MNEAIKTTGQLTITLRDGAGNVKECHLLENLIVTTGLGFLANAILNASASPMTAIAVGTGTAAAALANTALQTELYRAAFSSSSVVGPVATMNLNIGPGAATGAITEAGIFNQNTLGGIMMSRVVFPAINKQAADSLSITWTITES